MSKTRSTTRAQRIDGTTPVGTLVAGMAERAKTEGAAAPDQVWI